MTLVNEREHAGDNSDRVFSVAVSDTNEHDLPDADGDDSAGGDAFSTETIDRVGVKVVNQQDQDATVRLEATNYDDPDFATAETVVSGVTVAASGGIETLAGEASVPFDWYRVVVSFATAPTGSSEIEAAFMTDHDGN